MGPARLTDPAPPPPPQRPSDPANSPGGRLLSAEHRAELASALVRAFLAQAGQRELSALEVCAAQAWAVHGQLQALSDPLTTLLPDPTDPAALDRDALLRRAQGHGRDADMQHCAL